MVRRVCSRIQDARELLGIGARRYQPLGQDGLTLLQKLRERARPVIDWHIFIARRALPWSLHQG